MILAGCICLCAGCSGRSTAGDTVDKNMAVSGSGAEGTDALAAGQYKYPYANSTSRKENIKPYYIFKDSEMDSLVEQMPENEEELSRISGFGNVKVEKYGKDILNIISSFSGN